METKLVGPYAWGTLLKVNLVADIAVITKGMFVIYLLARRENVWVKNSQRCHTPINLPFKVVGWIVVLTLCEFEAFDVP
jgi:hypothetical protein